MQFERADAVSQVTEEENGVEQTENNKTETYI